jgi:signal peptidase II
MKRHWILVLGAVVTFAFDQYTKWQVLKNIRLREVINLIGDHFVLTHVRNTGAAFGIFTGYGRPFFLVVSVIAVGFILYFFFRVDSERPIMAVALSSIMGGALGNLFDRAFRGYVVDFIEVSLGGRYQWPTFNVADVAICVGVGILLLELLTQGPPHAIADASPEPNANR